MGRAAVAFWLRHRLDEREACGPVGAMEAGVGQRTHRVAPLPFGARRLLGGRVQDEVDEVCAARLACAWRVVGWNENLGERLQRGEIARREKRRRVVAKERRFRRLPATVM